MVLILKQDLEDFPNSLVYILHTNVYTYEVVNQAWKKNALESSSSESNHNDRLLFNLRFYDTSLLYYENVSLNKHGKSF